MSKSYDKNKVCVQKGPINPAEKTLKQMSRQEREADRLKELHDFKDGGTLKYNEPRK